MSGGPSPAEQVAPTPELHLDEDQMSTLVSFVDVADKLRAKQQEFDTDTELIYRYQGYLYEAGYMESRGKSAVAFKLAATGLALGAVKSAAPMKVIDAIHAENMIDGPDINVLSQFMGSLKTAAKHSLDDPAYAKLAREQLGLVHDYISHRKPETLGRSALELISLAAVWTASNDTGLRQQVTERIGKQFGPGGQA